MTNLEILQNVRRMVFIRKAGEDRAWWLGVADSAGPGHVGMSEGYWREPLLRCVTYDPIIPHKVLAGPEVRIPNLCDVSRRWFAGTDWNFSTPTQRVTHGYQVHYQVVGLEQITITGKHPI